METKIEITPEMLAKLKAKAKKATPGPWAVRKYNGGPYPGPFQIWRQAVPEALVSISVEGARNAEYISANDPQTVMALIDEIIRLRAKVERLEREADWLAENSMGVVSCPYLTFQWDTADKADWCSYDDSVEDGALCSGNFRECWRKMARTAVKLESGHD